MKRPIQFIDCNGVVTTEVVEVHEMKERTEDYPIVTDGNGVRCYDVMGHLVMVDPPPRDPEVEKNFHGMGWEREEDDYDPDAFNIGWG